MPKKTRVRGHRVGRHTIEVLDPIDENLSCVEVVFEAQATRPRPGHDLVSILEGLPPGVLDKGEADQRIREERDAWGGR